jgi:hypothetical protein
MNDQEYFFRNRGPLKQSMSKLIDGFVSNYFLTANFNREISYETAMELLKKWHNKLDRILYGKYFYKKKPEDRTFFFAFQEIGGKSGKLHFHLMVKVPSGRESDFEKLASSIWEKMIPSGDLDVRHLPSELDRFKTGRYSCKDLWRQENYQNFIVSTMFSNRQ